MSCTRAIDVSHCEYLQLCVCSLLLAQQGYHGIAVNYARSKDKAEAVVRQIDVRRFFRRMHCPNNSICFLSSLQEIAGRKGTAIAVKADVAIEAEVINLFNATTKAFGTVIYEDKQLHACAWLESWHVNGKIRTATEQQISVPWYNTNQHGNYPD